jgi:hypothetical protein
MVSFPLAFPPINFTRSSSLPIRATWPDLRLVAQYVIPVNSFSQPLFVWTNIISMKGELVRYRPSTCWSQICIRCDNHVRLSFHWSKYEAVQSWLRWLTGAQDAYPTLHFIWQQTLGELFQISIVSNRMFARFDSRLSSALASEWLGCKHWLFLSRL